MPKVDGFKQKKSKKILPGSRKHEASAPYRRQCLWDARALLAAQCFLSCAWAIPAYTRMHACVCVRLCVCVCVCVLQVQKAGWMERGREQVYFPMCQSDKLRCTYI